MGFASILRSPVNRLRRRVQSFVLEGQPLRHFVGGQALNGAVPVALHPVDPLAVSSVWAGSGKENMILIAGLARASKVQRYLEIGAYRGFTAGFVRWACPEAEIHAVDNWQRANTSASALFEGIKGIAGNSDRVFAHEGDSKDQLRRLRDQGLKFDLIYVDGCHSYEYAKSDYEDALALLSPSGTIVIDDTVTWWGPRELSEELQTGRLPEGFQCLEIETTNGLLILRRPAKDKAPLALTRENCPDGVWHDAPSRAAG